MKKLLLFTLLFLSSLSFLAQYSAIPNNTYVTTGDNTPSWGSNILEVKCKILSTNFAKFYVRKQDGSNFNSAGKMYIKIGGGNNSNQNIEDVSVAVGSNTIVVDVNLENYSFYPQNFYARYEVNNSSGYAWVGPIRIEKEATPVVTSVTPNNAILGHQTTFDIYGSNLTSQTAFFIENFGNGTVNASSSTTHKTFTTTATLQTGTKSGEIKDQSGGSVLYTFNVSVTFPTPTNLNPQVQSYSEIYINWGLVSYTHQYRLFRATSANGSYTKIYQGTNRNYTDSGLSSNTTYYYKVQACQAIDDTSCSNLSTYKSATTTYSTLPTPTVSLIAPNSGSFQTGEVINFDWTSTNQEHWEIDIEKNGVMVGYIESNHNNKVDKSYNWTVPTTVSDINGNEHTLNGDDYKVKIIIWNSNDPDNPSTQAVADYSTSFLSFNQYTTLPTPTVSLIAPNSGSFHTSDVINFDWTSTNQEHWEIDIEKNGVMVGYIESNHNNKADTSYNWTVPTTVSDINGNEHTLNGDNYKVKMIVWNSNDPDNPSTQAVADYSTSFLSFNQYTTLPTPTVSLIAPNSGSFQTGEVIKFDWISTNQEHWEIDIEKNGVMVGYIESNHNNKADTSYNWTVPTTVSDINGNEHTLNGDDYKVKIIVWNSNNPDNPSTQAVADYSTSFLSFNQYTTLPTPTVSLIAPNSGSFHTSDVINFDWTSTNQEHWEIDIEKNGVMVGYIESNHNNKADTSYNWTVPTTVSDINGNEHTLNGDDFKIKMIVWNSNDPDNPSTQAVADFSTSFLSFNTNTACNFTDALPTDNWYDSVQDLCARGILEDDGECDPVDDLNRAELAKLAYLSIGLNASNSFADNYPSPFIDLQIQSSAWYYSYAKNLSYLEFDDHTAPFDRQYFNFRPSASISRAHTLKVLLEAFNIDETNNSGNNPYNDVVTTGEKYDANYIIKAKDLGIIDNDSSFSPNDYANRAETFVMLHRMLTVLSLPVPNITENDFYKAGNYIPDNFGNFSAMHSGNFSYYKKTSFGIPSIGIPLVFSHSYNSYLSDIPNKLTPIQPLGKLWSHSFNGYLQEIQGDTERPNDFRVVFTLPNGGFQTYKKQGSTYVPETEGIYDELVKTNSSTFTLTTKAQIVYTFQKLSGTDAEFPFVLTAMKDRNNNTLTITYENAFKSGYKRIDKVTGTAGRELQFFYHTQSDLLAKVDDPLGRDVDFIYNSYGYLSRYTNPKHNHTYYNYGSGLQKEMLTSITLPKGNIITNTYEQKKLKSSKTNGNTPTQYNYSSGYKTTITSGEGKTIETTYNNLGNPTKIEQASTTVNIGYTDNNHKNYPTSVTYNGQNTSVTYDSRGNVTQRNLPLSVTQNYQYNAKNDLEKFTDAEGFEYNYSYNSTGNLTQVETPRGSTNFTVNSKGQITQITNPENISVGFVYDSYGNVTQTNAPLGITSSNTYDIASRLTSATNPNGHTINYSFDTNDNLLQEIFNGQTTSYEFDANDNLLKIINAKNNATTLTYNTNDDTLEKVQFGNAEDIYSYYDDGSIKTYTNPKGLVFTYIYDDKTRLESVSGGGKTISYTYDSQDRTKTVTNENGAIEFEYDDLDRITQTTDYYGNTVRYQYDKNSNITKITYPNNKEVSYTFYDDNLLQSVTDWNGQTTNYTYRNDGLLSSTLYPNGTTCNFSYDGAGRMTTKTWKKSDNTIINGYEYELDKLGNHTKEIKTEPFGVIPFDTQSVNSTFNNENEITSDGTDTFAHDDNGNNTSNGNTTYSYDVYDQLTSVSSTGFNASYKYDAFGHRREKTANGVTQRFVLNVLGLSNVLLETDANNNAQNYYIYGLGLVARIDASNTTHYYHDDFRGSIIALTDTNETITHKYQYTDFGAITQIEEANYNPYRYVGKHGIQFEANGLYFMRARYYDAHTGRFLTEDPVWATNLYPYAGNNPINSIDPAGTSSLFIESFKDNFTTSAGGEAAQWYADRFIATDNYGAKALYYTGGLFASLWSPDTALYTAFTLGTAGVANIGLKYAAVSSATGSSRILSWGSTAKGHLIRHAGALGFSGITAARLQKHLPQLRAAANQLYNNVNPSLTRFGDFGKSNPNALFYITNNGKMLITKLNGEFITILNTVKNGHYNKATPFK